CDEHSDYKDAKLLYRFRKDDGTFLLNKEVKVFLRGQSLYETLIGMDNSILKAREENLVKYQRSFLGCEMVDWLVEEGEVANRKEATELCQTLLEHGIIQHGDAVGWGFVVRGGQPCHIQAVDPGGPAAAAGMKVCQFVYSVNGMYVLHLDYQTVSNLIVTGPRTLVL
ncbi:hypothetical protein E2320_009526, partial [Naja naja]